MKLPVGNAANIGLSILRFVSGLIFMQHGMQKLFLWPPSPHHPGPLAVFSITGLAGFLEFFGGLSIVFGLGTRAVAFILSGEMAFAYWMVHFPAGLGMKDGWMPVVNQGDLAILFCFVFLYLALAGGGPWSIDALMAGSQSDNANNG
ncbi:DoxX family protein [Novosphingobium sediminicola]|uniref:Putative oxidoreductase n=1 Tax=Novosphingobium sediminicola TaxID=563162 RepID=A0A7W6CN81_9SPHN|nr:DoxX family protein [Novosphingobium sediminicola]MBB3957724.1 putative oxidoreductase [Novosphingobium sediminicola]